MTATPSSSSLPNDGARSGKAIVALLLLGIISFYALSWVWSAKVLTTATPLWSVAIRLAASWAVVVAINRLRGTGPSTAPPLGIGPVLCLSIIGFGGFFGLTYLALVDIPASLLVLVLSTIPILTLLQGVLLFGMRAGPLSLIGVGLIALAIILYAFQIDPAVSAGTGLGIVFGLMAAVGYSFYGLLYKKWASGIGVMDLLPRLLLPSAIGVAALALAIEGPRAMGAVNILSLAVIGAAIAAPVYVMYNALILRAGPLVAGSISVAAPITTFVLEGIMMQGQRLAPGAFALVLLGAAGVALLVLANQKPKEQK